MQKQLAISALVASFLSVPVSVLASDGFYISGSYGINQQDDSTNDGTFTNDFTTGSVTGVTPPLSIPAGNKVGWKTEFEDGDNYTFAVGRTINQFRVELEYSNSDAEIDTHTGVSAAGIDLSAIDAGVLLTGNDGDLGVNVADLVADGRGDIDVSSFYINGYYDFDNTTDFTPYIGIGIGQADIDITYAPSGVSIIDDSESGFIYQLIVGVAYSINDQLSLFGNYRYRDGDDVEVSSPLLTADFDIENKSSVFDFGLRYSF